jgi:2-methylcitrate dehydratase PrpD
MADNTTTGANGWSSDTYGPFGAAATAGKILKFTEQEMRSALGFAYAQASAGYQILQSPGYSAVNQGLAARSGALSALLAQRGLSGPEDVFEGKYGFYRLYLGGKYDPAKALARLGEEYEGSHLSFKAYPCCLFTHGPVEAVKEILRTHAAQKDSFSRLIVRTNRSAHNLCCEPLPEKRRPSSRRSAMFSIPYVLGNYLVKGRVLFEDFQEDKIGDPRVLQMASKVDPEIDPVLDRVGTASSPSIVEVVLSDGRKYSARIDHIKGHPQNPMEFDECAAKFKQCAAYSARAISGRQLEECIAMIKHLEEVEDVRSILKGLIG